jgi:F subunit of K+-transporting ATPase (Potass_KdpF)
MCLNLGLAPAIYAANQVEISQGQAYAIGLLLLTTLALSIYLFAVIFVPERF